MDLPLRLALVKAIESSPTYSKVVDSIKIVASGSGTITYQNSGVWVDPEAPSLSGYTASIGDEELVRAYLLTRLVGTYEYSAKPECIEIEKVYKPVGRPTGKGGRIDVLVRKAPKGGPGTAFLFIECKAPSKFDDDLKLIDGQLFRLSMQEAIRPRFLVYYTVELKASLLSERVIIIDTETFGDYEAWDKAGQPIADLIPKNYGLATKRRYAKVPSENGKHKPLDREATPETFHRLRTELHDVVWGGAARTITKCLLLLLAYYCARYMTKKKHCLRQSMSFSDAVTQ